MQADNSVSTTAGLRQGANRWLRAYGTFVGFVAMIVIFSLLRPGVFLSPNNLRNITEQVAILAIVATTMTVVMVVGDFDLSVGALASLSGVVVADLLIRGVGLWPGVVVALLVGAVAGLFNGLLVAYFGLSAFVATLATMTAFRGLALFYTNGSTLFSGIPESFKIFGQSFTALTLHFKNQIEPIVARVVQPNALLETAQRATRASSVDAGLAGYA